MLADLALEDRAIAGPGSGQRGAASGCWLSPGGYMRNIVEVLFVTFLVAGPGERGVRYGRPGKVCGEGLLAYPPTLAGPTAASPLPAW